MRIHGHGGFAGAGPQANWKRDDQQSPPQASQAVQGSGWGNWKDKGQGDQFQASFDLSQQGNNSNQGPGNWHGRRGFGNWQGQGDTPFKVDNTKATTPAPVPASEQTQDSSIPPSQSSNPPSNPGPTGQGANGALFPGGKEGLGVSPTSSNGDGSNLAGSKLSWYYNWSPNPTSQVNDPNATFIPMIWGRGNMNPKDLEAAANSKSPMILTFNEPDHGEQAKMSVDEALSYWDQLEATGKQLSSPAVTNGPDGVKWLDEFMTKAKASGKRVDSISLHWYGSSSQPTQQKVNDLKTYIESVHNKYPNLPINLTEFGVDASGLTAGKDQAFLAEAEKMLNSLPYVQIYAPYGTGQTNGN